VSDAVLIELTSVVLAIDLELDSMIRETRVREEAPEQRPDTARSLLPLVGKVLVRWKQDRTPDEVLPTRQPDQTR
jgi:hypothetical protein